MKNKNLFPFPRPFLFFFFSFGRGEGTTKASLPSPWRQLTAGLDGSKGEGKEGGKAALCGGAAGLDPKGRPKRPRQTPLLGVLAQMGQFQQQILGQRSGITSAQAFCCYGGEGMLLVGGERRFAALPRGD